MEHKLMDDDMGFEKVDDETGLHNIDEDMEYVKVEKVDDEMGLHKIDEDMEYVKVDADVGYEQEKVDANMEYVEKADADEGYEEKADTDVGYEEEVDTDMEYEWEKEDDDMEYEWEKEDDDIEYWKGDENSHILNLPLPLPRCRKDMDLQDLVKDFVLPYLPAKALVRFRCVSREWDRWIGNPFLAHQQSYYFKNFSGFFCQDASGKHTFESLDNTAYGVPFQPLKFLPEPVNILSSCNGLLLCHGCDALDPYYICNPATQEWINLPPPQLYHGDEPSAVLAFDPCALNMEAYYQLLCVVPTLDHVFFFEQYSSRTGSWKVSETTLVEMKDSCVKGNGFYMKGIAYMETSTRKVIAFHLSTELYEVISLPTGTPSDGALTQVKGELCYIGLSHLSDNEYSVMIFTGMDLGLRRRLDVKIGPKINDPSLYRVLPCLDGDNVIILVGSNIYSYSTMDQIVKVVTSVGNTASLASSKCLPYTNSLVEVAKSPVYTT